MPAGYDNASNPESQTTPSTEYTTTRYLILKAHNSLRQNVKKHFLKINKEIKNNTNNNKL